MGYARVNPGGDPAAGSFRTNETKSCSMHGVRRENLSKSGALERIGIALAGIVGHRQTVNKGFSDIRNFSFAEFASGGFPNILQRVSESTAK
jgi:hypothetical protein